MNNELSPQNRIWYVYSVLTHSTVLLYHLQLSVSTSEYSVLGDVVAGDPALDRTGIPGRALNYRPKIDVQAPQCTTVT